MKQITVGIDVDDTIANLIGAWLSVYNVEYDDNIFEGDIKSWVIADYVKCGNRIYDYLKFPQLYDMVRPIDGATEGIRSLRELGFKIVFVTASTPEQSGRKYKWLCDYGMIEHRNEYVEALDKSLILCDYLIDDNPQNVVCANGKGIVFTREWNKNLIGYHRVNDWGDIVAYFVNIANQREIIGV